MVQFKCKVQESPKRENVLKINTPGGPVEFTSGSISPGDNVVLETTPAGLVAITDGAPGSATGGGGGTGVGPGLTYGGKQVTCIKITDGFVNPPFRWCIFRLRRVNIWLG